MRPSNYAVRTKTGTSHFPTVCSRAANAGNSAGSKENSPSEVFTSTLLETRISRVDGGRISGSQPRSKSRSWQALSNVAYLLVITSQQKSKRAAIATTGEQRMRDLTMIRLKFVKHRELFFV